MPESFAAPTGTRDVLPPESARWERLIALFARQADRAGYGLVQSPMFEDAGVFNRVGEGTDVVRKEMYDFLDKGGRPIALRPEGTASVVRAYVQHRPTPPWKVWYAAPNFRYERPQAGRYRQHHQLGVEALGAADPDLDVEVIALTWAILQEVGLRKLILLLNSMGTVEDRTRYVERLRAWLRERVDELAPEDRENATAHPMRVLDSKRKATREVTADAPKLLEHLGPQALAHFDRVQAGLGALDIPFAIEPRLVRGLDYYTHTTFEVQSSTIDAAQSTVSGGGRYDGLAEALGGPPTPGMGFGMGIERVLLAADAEGVFPAPEDRTAVFVIDVCGGDSARDLTHLLRREGISADRAFDDRSMKAQFKAADRSGARLALVIGEQELKAGTVTVRDLRSGEQTNIVRERILDVVKDALS